MKSTAITAKIVAFLIKYRFVTALLTGLATIFWAYTLKDLTVDNNAAHAIPDTLFEKRAMDHIRENFDSPYSLLFTAQLDSGTLDEKINLINTWAQRFQEIKSERILGAETESGEQPGFQGVAHIGALRVPIRGGMLGMKTVSLLNTKNEDILREYITENHVLTKNFISDDEKTFLMLLYTNENVERHGVITDAVAILDSLRSAGYEQCYITGATATSWYMSRDMSKDFAILIPLAILISIILLYRMFRSWRCVFASLLIVAIAIVWTFGLMALMDIPLNVLTSVIPLILFPVGLAGSLHVIKTYRHHRLGGLKSTEAFIKTYEELLKPIFLAAITTFIGFSSFVISSLSWTRYFGFFTGFGVLIALLFTIILLPALFYGEKDITNEDSEIQILPMSLVNKAIFDTPFAKFLLIFVILFSVIFLPKITFESNPITFFDDKHDVKISDEIIGEEFGGTRFFDLMIESETPFEDSAAWAQVAEVSNWIQEKEEIGTITSMLPMLQRVSMILKNTPMSETAVTLLMGNSALMGDKADNLFKAFITDDRKAIKLTVICKNIPQFNYSTLAREIVDHINTQNPTWKATASGEALLIDSMITLLVKTQVISLSITFLTVAFVLMLLFRSVAIGLYATLPIIAASCFIAGLMALFGVSINMVTIIVINSSIGIGIDYAIHLTSGYILARKQETDNKRAILMAIQEKGTVIIFNTVAVGVGFLILALSSFPPVRLLGIFIFLSMAVCSLFSILFLPIFLDWRHTFNRK